jgi:EAL domain-containing protein (putative c-di-GMP-specific phosphodiesterase class I)/GGDEF domain-containing protein
MSLSKQLLILMSFIFFIVFAVNFVLSMNNIKDYLETESEVHVQDTATSLGLSLSPHMTDEQDPIIRTMMNAIFDGGYYKEMRLADVDDKDLVTLTNTDEIEGVPNWLITLMPMKVATAVSEISSGWSISGTLYITTNPGYAYLKLYEQGKSTLKISILIFLATFLALFLALRLTLQSLKNIEKQANEISDGHFTSIKLPWTLEIKNVAQSMNSMSSKIGEMIDRLNQKLESLNDSVKRDPLTQLFNQTSFETNVKQMEVAGQAGYAAFIKFDNLADITKDKGNKAVDEILVSFSQFLANKDDSSARGYRLYGSEFAMLFPDYDLEKMTEFAKSLQHNINILGAKYDLDDIVHTGIVRFERSTDFDQILPAMVEAYEQAKLIGHNAYFIQQDSLRSMSDLDWKSTITAVIENDSPEIILTSEAYNYAGKAPIQVMQEAFTVVKDSAENNLPIGTFFSMAQEFGLEEKLDQCIVNKIIALMEDKHQQTPVTINLSMTSISSYGFRSWLKSRVRNSTVQPELLAFSVTAYSAAKNLNNFAKFSLFAQSLGATTLLKRYSSDIIEINLLKDLHVSYIRLSRDITSEISLNRNKADLLNIMQEVTNFLNIKVIAESVSSEDDFELVKSSHIYAIGR